MVTVLLWVVCNEQIQQINSKEHLNTQKTKNQRNFLQQNPEKLKKEKGSILLFWMN